MKVLVPIPTRDFDPTEVAVPWKILSDAGIEVRFATPGGLAASADPIMVTGKGLGLLKFSMMADRNGRASYESLLASGMLKQPLSYAEVNPDQFGGLILPGGHAPGMKEYLESETLKKIIIAFFTAKKPVGAICHGVVAAARSGMLRGRKTTALPRWMELLAWNLTRHWMGNYYRTYPKTVENEVAEALERRADFLPGPLSLTRDSSKHLKNGFVVEDGNYLSARWPGDAHLFAHRFLKLLEKN